MALRKVTQKDIIKKRYKPFHVNKKYVILGLIVFIISFFIDWKKPLFVAVFMVLNSLLLRMDRYIQMPVDLEFSTFSAILATLAFGLKWGILTAVITKVAAMIYNANIRADHFFMIIGYILAAFIASIFPWMDVVYLGLLATVIINIYTVFVSLTITHLYPVEILMYGITNIFFNFILFLGFAGPIYGLIK